MLRKDAGMPLWKALLMAVLVGLTTWAAMTLFASLRG
jgi:hypothetical protein